MNKENIKLSIVIPHYHTPEILKLCLDALIKKLIILSGRYEIIVSDGETDKSVINNFRKIYPEVLFVENLKNIGFSKLVNHGIDRSSGEYIFIVNADIIAEREGDILDMMDYLDKHEDVGLVAPKLFNVDGSAQQTYFRNYNLFTIAARRTFLGKTFLGKKLLDRFYYGDLKVGDIFEPDWVLGAAFLMKRDRFEKIGAKLDERFFMYFEDVDLCRRFKEVGLKVVYFPSAKFIHRHARASDKGRGIADVFMNRFTRIHILSYLKYLWKWNVERYFGK